MGRFGVTLGAALLVGIHGPIARAQPVGPAPPEIAPAPAVTGPESDDEPIDEEEVVRVPRARRDLAAVTVGVDEARRVPGTQGDSLKVVQNLPGVARASFGGGQIVVWGSAPRDTRVYVDGVEVPALYHGSGLRSTINSDLVKSVELVPGAYGADYGRGLGGLVRVETRPLPEAGLHGYVAADFLDASAMATAAIGSRLRVGIAGRVSYLDRILEGVLDPDIGDFYPIPRYRDLQGKATLALRKDEELSALFLTSHDALDRTIPSSDPEKARREATESSFYRGSLHYTRILSDGASVAVTPFVGYDRSDLATRFGAVPTRLTIGSLRYGLRASHRGKVGGPLTLSTGIDVLGSSSSVTRDGTIVLPPREGDVSVFGEAPGDEVNADDWTTHVLDIGPHAIAEIEAGPLTITPGLRFDAFLIEGSRLTPRIGATPGIGFTRLDPAFDPRLSIRYRATAALAFTLSGGIYHQAPEPEELSAVFGTPELTLARAVQVSAGESLRITATLSAEVVGFYKTLDDLIVRTRLPAPKLARSLVQDGEGRSYGAQLLLRQELWNGFFGWISYAISRSERKYVTDPGYRLFDYDQPHVLSAVASQEYRGFTLGARFRASTGAPRTPVVGSFYDARGDDYQPVFGRQNTIRLPDFYQLDLRLEKAFHFSPVKLTLSLDVLNVTYRKNPEEVAYNYDFTELDYITGLPTLAVLGARVEL